MTEQISINKRAIRNGGIIALIIAAIGLYQGETVITAAMTFIFSWAVVSAALWLSYKITAPKNKTESEENPEPEK